MNEKQTLILEILRDHPAGLFGLEILRIADGNVSRNSLSVHLGNLEGAELVTSERIAQPVGLPRPRYRISRKGRRILDEGMARSPQAAH